MKLCVLLLALIITASSAYPICKEDTNPAVIHKGLPFKYDLSGLELASKTT